MDKELRKLSSAHTYDLFAARSDYCSAYSIHTLFSIWYIGCMANHHHHRSNYIANRIVLYTQT